jgi:hypothetical protein
VAEKHLQPQQDGRGRIPVPFVRKRNLGDDLIEEPVPQNSLTVPDAQHYIVELMVRPGPEKIPPTVYDYPPGAETLKQEKTLIVKIAFFIRSP